VGRFIILLFLLLCGSYMEAQRFADQVPQIKRYDPKEVIDPDYGIIIYNRMVGPLGGDSVRFNKSGYNLQGWQEDYYESGKLLHKGYYVDGLIKIFKNFYENGQVERNFTNTDPKRSYLDVYYPDGKARSQITFYDGNTYKQYDFFPNGNPEYVEENDKDMEYLYKRNSYYENGLPASIFEITDKKAKKYIKKEYYENGKVKEEGPMRFRKEMRDYQKDGDWTYYNDKGEVIKKEKYENGELVSN